MRSHALRFCGMQLVAGDISLTAMLLGELGGNLTTDVGDIAITDSNGSAMASPMQARPSGHGAKLACLLAVCFTRHLQPRVTGQ
jgi:hypothetical protein